MTQVTKTQQVKPAEVKANDTIVIASGEYKVTRDAWQEFEGGFWYVLLEDVQGSVSLLMEEVEIRRPIDTDPEGGKTIEETLEPLRLDFIARHKADTLAEVARRREVRERGREFEKEFAFAIWEMFQDRKLADRHASAPYDPTEWKVGDVTLRAWGSDFRQLMHDLRTSEDQAKVALWREYVVTQEAAQKAQNYLDRVGAWYGDPSDEKLEKMALRAWISRLATLTKAIVRKGLDEDSALVKFFSLEGSDYVLEIEDKDGRQAFARTILAGGPQVRLHLRFICT